MTDSWNAAVTAVSISTWTTVGMHWTFVMQNLKTSKTPQGTKLILPSDGTNIKSGWLKIHCCDGPKATTNNTLLCSSTISEQNFFTSELYSLGYFQDRVCFKLILSPSVYNLKHTWGLDCGTVQLVPSTACWFSKTNRGCYISYQVVLTLRVYQLIIRLQVCIIHVFFGVINMGFQFYSASACRKILCHDHDDLAWNMKVLLTICLLVMLLLHIVLQYCSNFHYSRYQIEEGLCVDASHHLSPSMNCIYIHLYIHDIPAAC